MAKDSRSGGKYSGTHTTLIPAAAVVCDIAEQSSAVARISPGFIKAGLRSIGGRRRVKLTERDGAILAAIRDNTSHQEVHIYVHDMAAALRTIAAGAKKAQLQVVVADISS